MSAKTTVLHSQATHSSSQSEEECRLKNVEVYWSLTIFEGGAGVRDEGGR